MMCEFLETMPLDAFLACVLAFTAFVDWVHRCLAR